MRRLATACALGLLMLSTGHAEPLDAPSADALAATLDTLRQGARAEPLDPRLGAIDASPETQRAFDELAATIFSELAARYDGDPDRMSEALSRGKTDPAGFAEALDPATRRRLEALSRQLEAR